MKTTTSLLIASLLFSSFASASPANRVEQIRNEAGTEHLPRLQLGLSAEETQELDSVPFRFFSSVEVKRRFDNEIQFLALDERLGVPLPFDPGQSAFEHRVRMQRYRIGLCETALNKLETGDKKHKLKGNAAFLEDMRAMANRLLRPEGDKTYRLSDKLETKLTSKVREHLAAASKQIGEKNPTAVLGDVKSVDEFGGSHFRIRFANTNADVSLPMLVSFLSGKDGAFVRISECSARRLKGLMSNKANQQKFFHVRPDALPNELERYFRDALSGHRLLAKLNGRQLMILTDTLLQLDHKLVMTDSEYLQKNAELTKAAQVETGKEAGKVVESPTIAKLEFVQFFNKEMHDFEGWLKSRGSQPR